MAEITACKENMSEQKADGSPAKKKIRTLDDAPNESHEPRSFLVQVIPEFRETKIYIDHAATVVGPQRVAAGDFVNI